jgi:hypothetical protein
LGWVAHYLIGTVFALVFVLCASEGWLERPTLLPAVAFGAATTLVPYFVMQPSFGLDSLLRRRRIPIRPD